jgi:hypothetical protein
MIPGCQTVVRSTLSDDKQGIDYIATLRRSAQIFIDAKTRSKGCSHFWTQGPEVALETWSIRPGGRFHTPYERRLIGWTLSEAKITDYIFFKFDPADTLDCFLLPFQLLRIAFRHYFYDWYGRYKVDIQRSYAENRQWESECIFVPISCVFSAIETVSKSHVCISRMKKDDKGELF